MIDLLHEIGATQREVGRARLGGSDGWAITLRRTLQAPIEDVWDAITNPDRVGRWFLPISGDYRLGGHYQFEGNAGGEIVECRRPDHLKITWVFGEQGDGPPSEVDIRLTPSGDAMTVLEFTHTAVVPDEFWREYGPGAVGVGWDGGLLGLTLHLDGGAIADPTAWQMSAEGRDFYSQSSAAWGEAYRAAGADAETVGRVVANTTAFYAPPPEAS